jgi:hypothetical protein
MSVKSISFIVLFNFMISLLAFYLDVLPIVECGMLRSPTIICLFIFVFLGVLEFELKASPLLDRHSYCRATPPVQFFFFFVALGFALGPHAC